MKARAWDMGRLAAASLVVALYLGAASIEEASAGVPEHAWKAGHRLETTPVEQYDQGPYGRACEVAAADEGEWRDEMAAMAGHLIVEPAPDPPMDALADGVALLVSPGERSPYRWVTITSVRRWGNYLLVEVQAEPAGNMARMYSPYHLVKVTMDRRASKGLQIVVRYSCLNCWSPGDLGVEGSGASATSPQAGTTDGSPTQNRARSWGAVKALYR
jgi:hypothetical protein